MPLTARRRILLVGCVIFCSYGYFYEGGGWNQNTRFALVRAIIEERTLRIDTYAENTGDKAVLNGRVFADKAPGASFVAVPAVALVWIAQRITGTDVQARSAVIWRSYAATLAGAAIPLTLATVAVFWLAMLLGCDQRASAIAALVCGLGTPLWAYATILYGHGLAAGCLMCAFAVAFRMAGDSTPRRDIRLGLTTGLLAGWAVVTDYPSAIPVLLILAFAWWQARASGGARVLRLAVATVCGLAIAGAFLAGYSWLAFGSPFHIGYSSEPGYEGMRSGVFGVNSPKLSTVGEILFGSYRGLLPLSPVLIVAPIGYGLWIRRRSTAPVALTAAAIVLYYFALTAGYYYWEGGWSYGSRHLGPALPFLALAVAPAWQHGRVLARVVIVALFVASAGQSLVAVATTAQPPGDIKHPMRELLLPAFRKGELAVNTQSVLDYRPLEGTRRQLAARGVPPAAWNLGQKLGFPGLASLIPLVLLWLGCAVIWMGWTGERRGAREGSGVS